MLADDLGEDVGFNVLFLCTGNSARSIMAECILNRLGAGRFRAYSAGSHPKGAVHPGALETLRDRGHDLTGLRSKSWDEFTKPDAPSLDLILTVCDSAAAEACPVWPGAPLSTHWGVEDPAAFAGPTQEQRSIFQRVYSELERRIELLVSLPLEHLDRTRLKDRLHEIGRDGLGPRADRGSP